MVMAVRDAVDLVVDWLELNYSPCDTDTIAAEVQSWYDHSDIVEPEMLAAAVLEWGWWRMVAYQDWIDAKNKWFEEPPIQYSGTPSICEIEAAQHDMIWQG